MNATSSLLKLHFTFFFFFLGVFCSCSTFLPLLKIGHVRSDGEKLHRTHRGEDGLQAGAVGEYYWTLFIKRNRPQEPPRALTGPF